MERTLRDNDVELAMEAIHIVEGKETYRTVIPELKKIGFEVRRKGGMLHARKVRPALNMLERPGS